MSGLAVVERSTTKPEATNCFSINFQVNIMSLSRKFCVYLHFTPSFTSRREH